MARRSRKNRQTTLVIDLSSIDEMVEGLSKLSPEEMRRTVVRALNDSMDRAYDLSHSNIAKVMNLTPGYVESRMRKQYATANTMAASIIADGNKHTRLATYPNMLKITPPTSRNKPRGKGLIPGLPKGQRQAGVLVTVRRGGTKEVKNGFVLPLKNQTDGGQKYGIFKREVNKSGKLRPKHLFGPSVYQLFDRQAERIREGVLDDLEETVLDFVEAEIDKVI